MCGQISSSMENPHLKPPLYNFTTRPNILVQLSVSAGLLRKLLLWLHVTKGSGFLLGNPMKTEDQKPQQKHKELIMTSALKEKKKKDFKVTYETRL